MDFRFAKLATNQEWQDPPCTDDTGFTDGWWGYKTRYFDSISRTYYSLYLEDCEVARAEISCNPIHLEYLGLPAELDSRQIELLEVHSGYRRRGIGSIFVKKIGEQYPNFSLVAFSEEADEFWTALDWTHHPRADGEANLNTRSLFSSIKPQ